MSKKLLLPLIVALGACGGPEPEEPQLWTNLVSDCEAPVTQARADAIGIQLVFTPCGINDVSSFVWSPNGLRMFFKLVDGGYLLEGTTHLMRHVDVPLPLTNGLWVTNERVAFVIPPDEPHPTQRLAIFDLRKKTLIPVDSTFKEPRDLQLSDSLNDVFLTTMDASGARHPVKVDLSSGKVTPAFTWLTDPVDTFTYNDTSGMVGWGTGDVAHVAALDGSRRVDLPDARRAIVHQEGRWVALERPVPEVAKTEPAPLTGLDLYDLQGGRRYTLRKVQGRGFEWYRAKNYFGSFILEGIDGRSINRNVALVDFTTALERLAGGSPDDEIETLPTTVTIEAAPAPKP